MVLDSLFEHLLDETVVDEKKVLNMAACFKDH